jgi:CP family cyanate transporter-like MFS transporter
VALALRPQVVGIGPLLPLIRGDLGISHGVGGLLGTIPVMCMGLFALAAPWLGRVLGTERAIAAGVGAIGLFGFLRAVAPDPLTILLLTVGVGVGIAVVGPLLPIVVRHRAPGRAALATGVYAGGIVLGATLSGALAVPLAGSAGEWRVALAAFSGVAVASVTAWLLLERPGGPEADAEDRPVPPRLPWRRPRAWALAFVFGSQSVLFYAAVSWLPTIYVERGWSAGDAGLLLALMNAIGLLATFGGPAMAERSGSRRGPLFAAAAFSLAGLLGITTLPDLAVPAVVALGIGLGAVFPLALSLPVDLADRPDEVGGLAAIMLFGGYAIASLAPVVLGLIRDATGGFELGLWLLVGIAVLLAAACWWFIPAGLGRRS